jgi:light-regulated signal transduction histidine kinase (bacteriophytochrome)
MATATCDLGRIADAAIAALRERDPARVVTTTIASPLVVRGDPRLLRIALDNLVGNAWKFTARTANPTIELATTERDGETVYVVRDNGAGFDMAYAQKLFAPFQRLHQVDEFAGTGIGLATVKRIIARHGGRIWADAKPGQGASFYFTLPT